MKSKKVIVADTGEILDEFNDNAYGVRHPLSRPHLSSFVGGESRTEQSHKDTVCINRIMRAVERTGVIPVSTKIANYGDVSHLNVPLDELIATQRDTEERLVKYTQAQKEKIRLSKLEKRKQMEADAAAFRAMPKPPAPPSTTPPK